VAPLPTTKTAGAFNAGFSNGAAGVFGGRPSNGLVAAPSLPQPAGIDAPSVFNPVA